MAKRNAQQKLLAAQGVKSRFMFGKKALPVVSDEKNTDIEQKKDEGNEQLSLLDWGKSIASALVIALVIMQFFTPTVVQQHSMEPNFNTNDYVFVSKQAFKLLGGKPKLGDVIVFRSQLKTEDGKRKLLIKRVIGVPGDIITIENGKVYLNYKELDDSYTKNQYTNGDIKDFVVPEKSLFCMGDNRLVSQDSRSEELGVVSYDSVIGKVVFRLFPLKDIGLIDNPYN